MTATFILSQVFTNPRDGSTQASPYGEYDSLSEAKRDAKGMKRWVIVKQTVVASSAETLTEGDQ